MNEEIIVLKKRTDFGNMGLGEDKYISFFSNSSDAVDAGLKYVEEENEEDHHDAKWEIQRVDRDSGTFHAERHDDGYIDILRTETVSKDEVDKGIDLHNYHMPGRVGAWNHPDIFHEEEKSHRIHDHESTPTSEGFGRRNSTKHAALENLKSLIKLANHLDSKGFAKEADYLDGIIKNADRKKTKHWIYWEEDENTPMFPVTAFELGLQKYEKTHIPFLIKKVDKAIELEIDNLFVDAIHKAEHISSNNIDMIKTKNSLRRKVIEQLDLFTTEQSQIDAAAKKVVPADHDLNPNSITNQNKRSLERAKR